MYVHKLDGTAYPQTWEEYERLVLRSTEDPDVVIGFRPGAWEQHLRDFLRGADEAFDLNDSANMTMAG